jgi:hypothetical protein
MKAKFQLDPAEVAMSKGWGFSESGKGQLTKRSRAVSLTSYIMELVHKPTDVKALGEIPPGHYSRQEMIKKREQLKQALFEQLEEKVAIFLKVRGR